MINKSFCLLVIIITCLISDGIIIPLVINSDIDLIVDMVLLGGIFLFNLLLIMTSLNLFFEKK